MAGLDGSLFCFDQTRSRCETQEILHHSSIYSGGPNLFAGEIKSGKLMSDEDVLSLIKKIIEETNAKDLTDIGKVMPLVMQKGKGKVDGKIANRILRSLLE